MSGEMSYEEAFEKLLDFVMENPNHGESPVYMDAMRVAEPPKFTTG